LYSFARKNPSSARSVSIFSNFVDEYRADAALKSNGHGMSDGLVNAERTQISYNYPQKCNFLTPFITLESQIKRKQHFPS